jgi:hypothetical protein
MTLDGLLGDMQQRTDLVVRVRFGDELDDLRGPGADRLEEECSLSCFESISTRTSGMRCVISRAACSPVFRGIETSSIAR